MSLISGQKKNERRIKIDFREQRPTLATVCSHLSTSPSTIPCQSKLALCIFLRCRSHHCMCHIYMLAESSDHPLRNPWKPENDITNPWWMYKIKKQYNLQFGFLKASEIYSSTKCKTERTSPRALCWVNWSLGTSWASNPALIAFFTSSLGKDIR